MREGDCEDSRLPWSNGRHSAIMPATMNCPGCQTPLRVRDEMAGMKIKCPRCSQVVSVPPREVETLEEVSSVEEITANPQKPKKAPAGTRPCPACGERISLTARRCRHCQADVEDDEDEEEIDVSIRKRSKYKPCPRCGEIGAKRVMWTFWGSFYGPALFTHVRCPECGYAYNGKSGRSNLIPAIVFVTIPLLIILAIFGTLGWYIHHQGYF